MRTFFVVMVAIVCIWTRPLLAETWTNAAGHSIDAELVDRKGSVVTLKRTDGTLITMPITALSEASRKAVEKAFPPKPKRSHDEIVRQRHQSRLKQLEQAIERQKQKKGATASLHS